MSRKTNRTIGASVRIDPRSAPLATFRDQLVRAEQVRRLGAREVATIDRINTIWST